MSKPITTTIKVCPNCNKDDFEFIPGTHRFGHNQWMCNKCHKPFTTPKEIGQATTIHVEDRTYKSDTRRKGFIESLLSPPPRKRPHRHKGSMRTF